MTATPTPLWVTVLALIGLPVVTGAIGWRVGENSLKKDYVQIASQIVQNEKNPISLRIWAGKILNEMSPIPFEQSVAQTIYIPVGGIEETHKNFILLSRNFLAGSFTQPCPKLDTIIGKDRDIDGAELRSLAKEYMICQSKMTSTRRAITEMDQGAAKVIADAKKEAPASTKVRPDQRTP